MPNLTCESCGEGTDVPRRSAAFRCPHCGAWIETLAWRRFWTTRDLVERVRADRDLPEELQAVLDRTLSRELEALEAALPRPRPAPKPSPAMEEPAAEGTGRPAGALPLPLAEEAIEPSAPKAAPRPAPAVPTHPAKPTRRPTPRKTTPRKPAARRGPTVWERLGPAFAEHLGFGLAAFLILAGAVYFTTTAWTTMSGSQRLLVIVGGLVLLGGVLFAAARLLNRSDTLPEVERTLLLIVAFLLPIAAIPTGILYETSVWRAMLATVVVFPAGFLVARRLTSGWDPGLSPFVPTAYVLLSALTLAGGVLGRAAAVPAVFVGGVLLVLMAWGFGHWVAPRIRTPRWGLLGPVLLLGFAGAVFAVRLAVAARNVHSMATLAATLGIAVAALGAALVTFERAPHARRTPDPRRSAVWLVVSMALGIGGTFMAAGNAVGLLAASLFGAYACLRAGLALPQPWFAVPGLILAAVAYLQSPAPIRELALRLRDDAADALGYADRPLPLAWYGLTFLPYVMACAWAGWAFLKRGHLARARVLFTWAFLAATGLSALALFASGDPVFSDLRAPAAVFAAQGALLLALGASLQSRWFAFAGALGIIAGAACLLIHVDLSVAVTVLALSALGLIGVLAALVLATQSREATASVRAALLDASAILAVVLFVFAIIDGVRLAPAPAWHGLGALLLMVLLASVAFALRRPEGIAMAAAALGVAGARFVLGLAPDAAGDVLYAALAALSAVPLLTPRIDALLPDALRHPEPPSAAPIGSWVPVGALAIQGLGLVLLLGHVPEAGWTLLLAAGLAVGASVLAVAAARETQPWPLYPAVVELCAAGLVAGCALTGEVWHGAGGMAGIAAGLVLTSVPLITGRPRALLGTLAVPLRRLLPVLVAPFAVWAFGLIAAWWGGHREAFDGWWIAAACLAVAGVTRLTRLRLPDSHALRVAALYGGTLFAPAGAALLIQHEAAAHAWPWTLLASAAAVLLWAGRDRRLHPPALLHLLLALAAATVFSALERGDSRWLLGAFLAVALGGWVLSRRLPVGGWVLVQVALLLGLSLPLARGMFELDRGYQPAVWLGFAAIAYLSLLIPRARVNHAAVRLVADPILFLGALLAFGHALRVAALEPTTTVPGDGPFPSVRGLRVAEGALGLAALARSLVLPFPSVGRRALALLAVGAASFAYAPLNLWIQGADTHFWRPDVEVGLLAIVLALLLGRAPKPRRSDGTGHLGSRIMGVIVLAGVAALLTVGELRNLSTPLALLAASTALFVLLLRDHGPVLAMLTGLGGLASALAFASWSRPMPGGVEDGLLLLYGAVSAVAAPALGLLARSLARPDRDAWVRRAGRELYTIGIFAASLALGFVLADDGFNHGEAATPLQILLAAVSLGLPGIAALIGALRAKRVHLIHVAILAGLLFYAFLATRTSSLDFLAGYHLHTLVVFGSTLVLLSGFHREQLGTWLAIDGLVLTLPAVARYAPVAFGVEAPLGAASSALALSAVAAAMGGRRLATPGLYGAAAVLVNLMLFTFWRSHGLVDPAFYGIPPGLTLIGGAMLLRGRISPAASLALVVPGMALVYGSVAVQVVQADEPLHALLLFGLGLATVVLGFLFKRNAWLVVGVTVIVLDVVVYLAVHGFESGFFGAALLVTAGLVVMGVAALATSRRRRRGAEPDA